MILREDSPVRPANGTLRRYAAGIAAEILSAIVIIIAGFAVALAGYLLWR